MNIPIQSIRDLGIAIRAVRKSQKLRLDDTAGSAGVGEVFMRKVERGKETVQFGRVLRVLDELGIRLIIDIPNDAKPRFDELKETGLKPLPAKRPPKAPADGRDIE